MDTAAALAEAHRATSSGQSTPITATSSPATGHRLWTLTIPPRHVQGVPIALTRRPTAGIRVVLALDQCHAAQRPNRALARGGQGDRAGASRLGWEWRLRGSIFIGDARIRLAKESGRLEVVKQARGRHGLISLGGAAILAGGWRLCTSRLGFRIGPPRLYLLRMSRNPTFPVSFSQISGCT